MKTTVISFALLFSFTTVHAQSDIIYPVNNNNVTRNYEITLAKNINTIFCAKTYLSHSIEAYTILKNGAFSTQNEKSKSSSHEPQESYKGHDYAYYQYRYKVAMRPKRVGVILTTVGISGGIFFSLFAANNDFVGDSRNDALIFSAIVTNVGVSL